MFQKEGRHKMDESNKEILKNRIHYALWQSLIGCIAVGSFYVIEYLGRSDLISFTEVLFYLIIISFELFVFAFFYYPRYFRKQEEYRKKMAAFHVVEEFKCLKCGASIKPEESKCKECGWTWNL